MGFSREARRENPGETGPQPPKAAGADPRGFQAGEWREAGGNPKEGLSQASRRSPRPASALYLPPSIPRWGTGNAGREATSREKTPRDSASDGFPRSGKYVTLFTESGTKEASPERFTRPLQDHLASSVILDVARAPIPLELRKE